ncbi:hypothetical protein [Streptomyces sp. NPDC059783]|uniref:hypothetical protein n=1 Tax=Streptomyces sp. NPDC059783 TaxID=3346944 RepID=UPI0036471FA7
MPYVPWLLESLAAYNSPILHPDPLPEQWDELLFGVAPPLTCTGLERLVAAARSARVTWAEPLLVWPDAADTQYALITHNRPDGSRRPSLSQVIDF